MTKYKINSGFLPTAKVSKGQQKSVISIGQQKSQQKSAISNQGQQFLQRSQNAMPKNNVRPMVPIWPKPMFHKIVICACNVLV